MRNDLVHISCLWIPQSFVNGLPRALRPALRERVAYHQYHLLLSVTSLRGELPMLPQCTDSSVPAVSISAWFGSLHRRKPQPNPTAKTLWEQVHFSPATRGFDPDTPKPKPVPTLLVTRRITKLLTPTSRNQSKAFRYLTQHLGTPCTADLKTFAYSHCAHSQVCLTTTWSLPHHALLFPFTAITDYRQFAQTLMRHRRWDMGLGTRFLRYAQHTKVSLLQRFYNRMSYAPPLPPRVAASSPGGAKGLFSLTTMTH